MYESNNIKELVENGNMLRTVESSINDIIEILSDLKEKKESVSLFNNAQEAKIAIADQIAIVTEQFEKMKAKRKLLLDRRAELIENLRKSAEENSAGNMVAKIDSMVMNLLKIDDRYIEKYNRSNPSIMAFIEDLLTKKKELM